MPHVTPEDGEKFKPMKEIESKTEVRADYWMRQVDTISVPQSTSFDWRLSVKPGLEKPRYVIMAFQTSKVGDQGQNPSIFDHCNVQSMKVFLNSMKYPLFDNDLDIAQNQFARVYRDFRPCSL